VNLFAPIRVIRGEELARRSFVGKTKFCGKVVQARGRAMTNREFLLCVSSGWMVEVGRRTCGRDEGAAMIAARDYSA
jgi:hypothetical protein